MVFSKCIFHVFSLGAYHDFGNGGPGDNRFDSIGNLCTGIGGLMDYQSSPDKWSPCSNEDIGAYLRYVLD